MINSKIKNKIIRFTIDGLLVGIVGGGFSTIFVFIVKLMFGFSEKVFSEANIYMIILYLLIFIIIGVILFKLLEFEPLSSGSGIPFIRAELNGYMEINEFKILISRIISGGLTSFAGMSLGSSGPSIHIGSSGAKLICKILRRDNEEMKLMMKAGAAVGMAVAYNAPIAGVVFMLEEIHKKLSLSLVYVSLIATFIATSISKNLMGESAFVNFYEINPFPLNNIYYLITIAVITGIMGVIFNFGMLKTQEIVKKLKLPLIYRMILVLITAFFIGYFVNYSTGTGSNLLLILIKAESSLTFLLIFLIAKILYTWFCYGSGVSGGLFFPILIIGGVCGAIAFKLLGLTFLNDFYINFIFLGMAGMMAATVKANFLSIILIVELTENIKHIWSVIFVVLLSYLISKLFRSRPLNTIFYEKLKSKF